MKKLILVMMILVMGCDHGYDLPEEQTEVAEVYDIETTDPDCISNTACTVLYEPQCMELDGAEGKTFLRNYKGCVCVEGIEYDYYEDKMCLEGCVRNDLGADYCKEDEQYFLDR